MACYGASGFRRGAAGSGRIDSDEKAHGGCLEEWRGCKKIACIFRFRYADLSVYLFCGSQYSNAGTATVLQSLAPLLILGIVCFKEKATASQNGNRSDFLCFTGVFLLSTHGNIRSMSITTVALLFGLGAAAGGAAYNLLSGDLLRHYGVYAVVGYAMLLAGVAMLPFCAPMELCRSF